jgi:hypothetical protein
MATPTTLTSNWRLFGIQITDRSADGHPRIRHRHVEPSEGLDDGVDGFFDLLFFGHIALDGQSSTPALIDIVDGVFEFVETTPRHRHRRSATGVFSGDGPADAGPAAGDPDCLSFVVHNLVRCQNDNESKTLSRSTELNSCGAARYSRGA